MIRTTATTMDLWWVVEVVCSLFAMVSSELVLSHDTCVRVVHGLHKARGDILVVSTMPALWRERNDSTQQVRTTGNMLCCVVCCLLLVAVDRGMVPQLQKRARWERITLCASGVLVG
jgi:hypothetical protein